MLVEAEDGSSFFCVPELAAKYQVRRGRELSPESWEELADNSNRQFAYLQCIKLLTRREHTKEELRIGLLKRGYPTDIVADTVDRVETEGSLSHERFAQVWLRSRMRRHPESIAHLRMGLQSKGLSSAEARASVDELLADRPDIEAELCQAAIRQLQLRKADPEVLQKKLLARGFSISVIRRIWE